MSYKINIEISHDQKVIGGILKTPDTGENFSEALGLRADHFGLDLNRAVFKAIQDTRAAGGSVSPYSLFQTLPPGAQKLIGGFEKLFRWAEEGFFGSDLYEAIKTVVQSSKRRRLSELAISLSNLSVAGEIEGGIVDAQGALEKILQDIPNVGIVGMDAAIAETLEALSAQDRPQNLYSGLKALDEYLEKVTGGEMIAIGARPGIGKSALAVQMLIASAEKGLPGLLLSGEMRPIEICSRQISQRSKLSQTDIRRRLINSKATDSIYSAAEQLSRLPIYIEETAGKILPDLLIRAKRMVQTHGIKIVVLDYLQLLDSGLKKETREREIAHMSASLKQFAQKTRTTVIALAQLNRSVEMRVNKIPTMADFRESGAIEQDSDCCFLMYRPEGQPNSLDDFDTMLVCDKNRNGKKGEVKVVFKGQFTMFEDLPEFQTFKDRTDKPFMDIDLDF